MRYCRPSILVTGIVVACVGWGLAQESTPPVQAEAVKAPAEPPKAKPIEVTKQYSRDSEGWHVLHNWNDGEARFYTSWRQFTAEGVRYLIVVSQGSSSGITQTVIEVK